jgi:predicted TPR repeat methyltransferase
MLTDYRRSHLLPDCGRLYDARFKTNDHRSMVWQMEKSILDSIMKTFYGDSEIHHLDFACGTGRILSYLEDRTSLAVGVDLSPSMLEVARQNSRSAEIYEADLTRGDILGDRKFNLITAFRFFPNAEDDLRIEAMQVLVKHLDDKGYLVFNNHRNTGSTRYRLSRFIRHGGREGMSVNEVKELISETGLKIVKKYHTCVFPACERHKLLPLTLLRPIEDFLSRQRIFQNLGENLIFVCRRANKKEK